MQLIFQATWRADVIFLTNHPSFFSFLTQCHKVQDIFMDGCKQRAKYAVSVRKRFDVEIKVWKGIGVRWQFLIRRLGGFLPHRGKPLSGLRERKRQLHFSVNDDRWSRLDTWHPCKCKQMSQICFYLTPWLQKPMRSAWINISKYEHVDPLG